MNAITTCKMAAPQVDCFEGAGSLWFDTMPQTEKLEHAKAAVSGHALFMQPCWDVAVALAEAQDMPPEEQAVKRDFLLTALRNWVKTGTCLIDAEHSGLRVAGIGGCLGSWQASVMTRPLSERSPMVPSIGGISSPQPTYPLLSRSISESQPYQPRISADTCGSGPNIVDQLGLGLPVKANVCSSVALALQLEQLHPRRP